MGERLDRAWLDQLFFRIGVDEVSWYKQARLLTLVLENQRRFIVWGDEGLGQGALDRFFTEPAPERSGLKPFVTFAKTIRKHKAGILVATGLGANNARHEGLSRPVRLVVDRAYGFHSAKASLVLVMLSVGPIEHVLPHERAAGP